MLDLFWSSGIPTMHEAVHHSVAVTNSHEEAQGLTTMDMFLSTQIGLLLTIVRCLALQGDSYHLLHTLIT